MGAKLFMWLEMAKKKTTAATKDPASKAQGRNRIQFMDVDFFRKEKENLLWNLKVKDMRAQDRRFGANFGIIGDVEFNKDTVGNDDIRKQYIVIDSERWKLKEKNDQSSRLIMRCFDDVVTDKDKDKKVGGTFRGGLELSMIDSLNLSIAAKKPLPSLYMFLPQINTLTQFYEQRRIGFKQFVFPLYPIDKEPTRFFKMIATVGIGDDFNIFEVGRKGKVAHIDHKPFNIGGRFEVEIFADDLQTHKTFPQILILACCMIKFLDDIDKLVDSLLKDVFNDKEDDVGFQFNVNPEELELLKNPRYLK